LCLKRHPFVLKRSFPLRAKDIASPRIFHTVLEKSKKNTRRQLFVIARVHTARVRFLNGICQSALCGKGMLAFPNEAPDGNWGKCRFIKRAITFPWHIPQGFVPFLS
jgi:hypothetical protein